MAESNQEPMSIEAFRAKKAAASTYDKPTASSASKVYANSANASPNSPKTRPAGASLTNSAKRSVSAENLSGDRYGPGLDNRQNKVKLLREKQAEDRRRRNEERRAAFEERKKKKEVEEKERWADLKDQAARHSVAKSNTSALKPGSGRKLPTVPTEGAAKRPGSAVVSPSRPSSLPKPLTRPVSANPVKSPSRSNTDSLSGGSTPKQSPVTTPSSLQPKTSLASSKSVSANNLNSAASRRSSSSSAQQRPSSGTKSRPRTSSTQTLDKPASRKSTSHETLLLPGGKLTKSHSTSSIHKVGQHKPTADKSHKTETKPKAGVTDEATAKQALAERRKKAREEAERQAALDKERQEAERLKKEEEERIRAEEEAREEARMRELAELLRKQEEERLRIAAEEKEKKDQEEAERAAAEKKHKEEEEQRAREEEEKKALEDEERRKQEEAARLERKRRVEQIMSRTRQTASPITTEESNSSAAENQEARDYADPDDTKRKVNEILQKVKGTSGNPNTLGPMEDDVSVSVEDDGQEQGNDDEDKAEEALTDTSESNRQSFNAPSNFVDRSTCDSFLLNGVDSSAVDSSSGESLTVDTLSSSPPLIASQQESNYTMMSNGSTNHEQQTVLFQYKEESSVTIDKENYGVNGTGQVLETEKLSNVEASVRHLPETKQDFTKEYSKRANHDSVGDEDEEALWLKIEATMKAREPYAVETLENLGVVAEGDNDEDSEEGQLWRVVEGKAQLAEVV